MQTLPLGTAFPNYTSSELRRYDLADGTDHLLWTYAGAIGVFGWDSTGILVNADTVQGNPSAQVWWLVDPVTGAATQHAPPQSQSFSPFKSLPGDPHNLGFTSLGLDAEGHPIWWIYNLDRGGAVNWVFYGTAPGERVTIYRGTQGDATGFDPTGGALADSTGIWFADNEHHTLWHWQQDTGLRKVAITGLPAPLKGTNSYVFASLGGPCS